MLCAAAVDLFHLLRLTTLVEVLDNDADEHVEHEEADEQQERDEVDEAPLVVIHLRLQRHRRATSLITPVLLRQYSYSNIQM